LYSTSPNIVFLSLDFFTLIEDIIYQNNKADCFLEKIERRINETLVLIKRLCDNLSTAQIFIDNFFLFRSIIMGTVEYNSSLSISEFPNIANAKLISLANSLSNLKIIDVLSLTISKGSDFLFDERMYYLAKCHWSFSGIQAISVLYQRYLNAFLGKRKKCLVLDLDNTLWGGIIGDDGIEGIELSNDGQGKAFYDFQREILKLYERGVILAICSKNSEDIALEAIEKHPYMILRKNHFVNLKINWNNKAQNIKEIAQEINIALDSIVFLDDSPFEREIVISNLPEVFVPELPTEPSEYPNFIRNLNVFDFITLSEDDFARNDSYKANINRVALRTQTINIEDFYFSLNMRASISKINESQINRIAQMTQKTNQFNLRTKRYTESDIKSFVRNSNYDVYQMSLKDKFGDNGIIACAIIRKQKLESFVDSFILSCRAMGRTAETALINYIIEDLLKTSCLRLTSEYIPTKKNMPCKKFYANHGFTKKQDGKWIFEMGNQLKSIPWLKTNE
jgi:FkbH-like protein